MFDSDHVKLKIVEDGGLSGANWRFYLLRGRLVVDSYAEWTRESKRHKPSVVRSWERLSGRPSTMRREEIPFTEEIGLQAKKAWLQLLQEQVQVGFHET